MIIKDKIKDKKCDFISSLEMMLVIVDREMHRDVESIIHDVKGSFKKRHLLYVINGKGTASSKVMDMLGLDSNEKAVYLLIDGDECIKEIKEALRVELHLEKSGNGILFSIPISKDHSIYKINREGRNNQMSNTEGFDMLVTIVNQGFSEEIMDAVKEVGARGGTVIRARRVGMEEAVKKFGISVQLEKEIILMIIPHTIEEAVLKAIKPFCGPTSEAKGLSFALEASNVTGIEFD